MCGGKAPVLGLFRVAVTGDRMADGSTAILGPLNLPVLLLHAGGRSAWDQGGQR